MKRWSIVFPAEHLVRHVNQTGGDYYACVRLSVEPYHGSENVAFVNAVDYADYLKDEPQPLTSQAFDACVEGVREGIEAYLHEKTQMGCPIAHVLITLNWIETHLIDSSPRAFKKAAMMAMAECFAKGGLIRID